jgi:hypothetical protein
MDSKFNRLLGHGRTVEVRALLGEVGCWGHAFEEYILAIAYPFFFVSWPPQTLLHAQKKKMELNDY